MSASAELTQPELFGHDEPPCPGYDVCPIGMCGCRFLGLGTPFASDVKKGNIYAAPPFCPEMVRADGFRSCGHAALSVVATTHKNRGNEK